MKLRYAVLACVCLLACHAWGEVRAQELEGPVTDVFEPTPTETLVLELINRARANPDAESRLCAEIARVMQGVDRAMFVREMQGIETSKPVFFDPRLVQAARAHSQYQAMHGISHEEAENLEGFTGGNAMERAEAVGFPVGRIGENVATGFTEAAEIHAGFIVDPIGLGDEGTGGMQPDRPHRAVTFSPDWRLVGIGHVEENGGASTVVYADANQRFAGGVVYCDLDGDGFYSVGEGIGNTLIRAGNTTVAGFQSGAYTIPLNQNAGVLELRIGPLSITQRYSRGTVNVKFDVVLTEEEVQSLEAILALQERLLLGVQSADIGEATVQYRQMKQQYQNTAIEPWLRDVELGLQMRHIYIQTANLYMMRLQPDERSLTRSLQQLQTMHQSMNSPEWQAFGAQVGEKFLTLVRTGEIDGDLVSTAQFEMVQPPADE